MRVNKILALVVDSQRKRLESCIVERFAPTPEGGLMGLPFCWVQLLRKLWISRSYQEQRVRP